jgi:hypothetical protein
VFGRTGGLATDATRKDVDGNRAVELEHISTLFYGQALPHFIGTHADSVPDRVVSGALMCSMGEDEGEET